MTSKQQLSLGLRLARLGLENPATFAGQARALYRARRGIPRERRRDDGLSAPPTRVQLHLTRRCNLRCFMCQQNRGSEGSEMAYYDPARELPPAAWFDILDRVASFRPEIHIIGGEPTVYKDWVEVVAEAKRLGLHVHLQTNGVLIKRAAERLVEVGLDYITVSLDGLRETHDAIRGVPGSFDRIVAGVSELIEQRRRRDKAGPIVAVNSVITKANLDDLPRLVDFNARLGVDIQQITHTFHNSPENVARHNRLFPAAFEGAEDINLMAEPSILPWEYYQSEIGPEDVPVVRRLVKEVKARAAGRMQLVFFPNIPDALIAPYYLDLNYPFSQRCDKLWKSATILPDGTLQSCFHVANGNVAEAPFLSVWNSDSMRWMRRIIARGLLPGCARCCNRSFSVR